MVELLLINGAYTVPENHLSARDVMKQDISSVTVRRQEITTPRPQRRSHLTLNQNVKEPSQHRETCIKETSGWWKRLGHQLACEQKTDTSVIQVSINFVMFLERNWKLALKFPKLNCPSVKAVQREKEGSRNLKHLSQTNVSKTLQLYTTITVESICLLNFNSIYIIAR